MEIYLPLLHNPDKQGKRKKQSSNDLKEIKNELMEHFGEQGLTTIRSAGEYKGQLEPQLIIVLDVVLRTGDIKWLRKQKREWARRLQQEEIYIIYYSVTTL